MNDYVHSYLCEQLRKLTMKKHLVLLVVMMLSIGVQAGEVLYAEIDGTNMTLKCGDSAPDGTAKYTGSDEWSRSFRNAITTVTIDASCVNHGVNHGVGSSDHLSISERLHI